MGLFEKIADYLQLGEIERPPEILTGGFLHQMYCLCTETGKYAVKLLNPSIMKRETAKENYQTAEHLETVLEKECIPIVPALIFHNRKMQEIDGQFFYLYPWYEGKALKSREITGDHCEKIGRILAQIHAIKKKREPYHPNELCIDWDFYIAKMKGQDEDLYQMLQKDRLLLYKSQERGNQAIKELPHVLSICHNDLDSKNVLWSGEDCRVIDLECLSYSSPFLELYETALCWSGYEDGNINFALLKGFIQAYVEAGGCFPPDWGIVYDSNYGRLEWLAYNINRVLEIDSTASERVIGISEVKKTLRQAVFYEEKKNEIFRCLTEL